LRNIINNTRSKDFGYRIALNSLSGFILETVGNLLETFGCTVEKTSLDLRNAKTMRNGNKSAEMTYLPT